MQVECAPTYIARREVDVRVRAVLIYVEKIMESKEFRGKSRTLSQIRGQWVFSRPFSFTTAHVVRGS